MTTKGFSALPATLLRTTLLLSMLLLAACSREESGKVDNIQLARFYADNGTYTLALSTLGQEQQKNPNDLRVYRELARIYHDLGYNSDALAEIDKAIEKGCEDCGELRLRILIASGKAAEADKQLASLGRTLPQERADFYRVQIDLRRNGDRQQALKRLESMALPEARSEYLRLLFAGQRYPEIVEIYQQRKGKPSPLDDMLLFAKTLYLLKRHEDADRALIELRLADKSDVITPRKIQTVELQVKNNIAQNKFTEAQAIYDAFLENYKGSGYVAMQEAVKDLKSSNFDDAIKNIEGLVEASPDNLQSAMILALAQFGKGDYRAVVNTLTLFRDRLDKIERRSSVLQRRIRLTLPRDCPEPLEPSRFRWHSMDWQTKE
jgi:thioredoxin-like negative regulator of GroEL